MYPTEAEWWLAYYNATTVHRGHNPWILWHIPTEMTQRFEAIHSHFMVDITFTCDLYNHQIVREYILPYDQIMKLR